MVGGQIVDQKAKDVIKAETDPYLNLQLMLRVFVGGEPLSLSLPFSVFLLSLGWFFSWRSLFFLGRGGGTLCVWDLGELAFCVFGALDCVFGILDFGEFGWVFAIWDFGGGGGAGLFDLPTLSCT